MRFSMIILIFFLALVLYFFPYHTFVIALMFLLMQFKNISDFYRSYYSDKHNLKKDLFFPVGAIVLMSIAYLIGEASIAVLIRYLNMGLMYFIGRYIESKKDN